MAVGSLPAVPDVGPAAPPGCLKAVVLVAHGCTKGDTVPGAGDGEHSGAAVLCGAAQRLACQVAMAMHSTFLCGP